MKTDTRMRSAGPARIAALTLGALTLLSAPKTAVGQVTEQGGAVSVEIFTRQDADRVLDLDTAVDLALGHSFSVYNLEQQFLQTSYTLENAKRQLRTRIDLSSTLPGIQQSINPELLSGPGGSELVYLRQGATWVNFGLNVVQPLITNGRIILTSDLVGFDAFQELPTLDLESRSVQPSVGINFNQPLFQYNEVRGQLRSAELSLERLRLSYTEEELRLINQVSRAFYDLYAQQRALELAADRFIQSDANYRSGVRRRDSGLIPETDVLRLEVTRANDEDALETARNVLEQRQKAFNRLVGLPLEERIYVEASEEFTPVEVNLDRALELAFDNRSDLRRAQIDLENQQLELRRIVSVGRPDLQLNAGYELRGNSSLSAQPSDAWDKHLKEALDADNRSPNTNVSLTLNIPLFDWGRNASLVQRQVSRLQVLERQTEEAQLSLRQQVTDRVRAVESAMRRMGIQDQNVNVAQTSYDFTRRRFERGEITTFELGQAQDQLSQTQLNRLSALIAYELAKADLREITLWDWERNQPVEQRTRPPEAFERNR
ncbi:TolC family protein [Gemmatimonadota bacterium]